jgi:hypothetical protein
MKKNILVLLLVMCYAAGYAQVQDPVKWSFTAKKINGATYEVHLTAGIESGWHTYSQTTPDGGPVKTTINFARNPLLTMTGEVKEAGKLEQHFEDLFGVEVKQFSNKVDFVQIVVVKGNAKTSLAGTIEFMTCNDHECLPPSKQKFSIALK